MHYAWSNVVLRQDVRGYAMSSNSDSGTSALEDIQLLREAKERFGSRILGVRGVIGLGIGHKLVRGESRDELALVALVERKLPREDLSYGEEIPDGLTFVSDGARQQVTVRTDVQEASPPTPAPHVTPSSLRVRIRPVPGGVRIGNSTGSGTLGGWAMDDLTGRFVFISNRHVLGDAIGTPVFQPLYPMPGEIYEPIGMLERYSRRYDATIGAANSPSIVATDIFGNGPAIMEIALPTVGMAVEKTGALTGHTVGRVDMINLTIDGDCQRATNAFRIRPTAPSTVFHQQGDSGSLIMEQAHPTGLPWKRCVGLLYCGSYDGSVTYAHQISDVFEDLSLVTVCEGFARLIDDIFLSATTVTASGFARDFEGRLSEGQTGREVVASVHENRASAMALTLHGDGRRAIEAALSPLFRSAVTTDDVLDHVIDDDDLERFGRVLDVFDRVAPDGREAATRARAILESARGKTIRSALLSEPVE